MNPVVLILIVLKLDLGLEVYLDLEFLVEFKGLELDLESGDLDLDRS